MVRRAIFYPLRRSWYWLPNDQSEAEQTNQRANNESVGSFEELLKLEPATVKLIKVLPRNCA
jgi:hypothetical protein